MKNNNYEQLEGWVQEIVHIECTKCRAADMDDTSDYDGALEHYYSNGWRARDRNCYCPSCAKKYKIK